MKLQSSTEHLHGSDDDDFDELFTQDKPVIFAFHGYLWLVHRLTYKRSNHRNFHVTDNNVDEQMAQRRL